MHRSIEQVLRCYVTARQTNWDVLLPLCEFAINLTKSATTGFTPAYILYGHEPALPLEGDVHSVTDCLV